MLSRARIGTCVAIACFAFGSVGTLARAAEPAKAKPAPDVTPGDDIDPKALGLLNGFGKALQGLPHYSFAVDFTYEVVQDDGQKLEFGSTRVYTVRRPDHLRIDEDRRVGGRREIYYDGDTLSMYIPPDKAYAQANFKQHRDLDAFIDVVEEALDIHIALGDLMRAKPLERIEEGLESAYIVGRENLGGVECDHVAWQTDEVDAEAWFSTGDLPLLQRAVVDYRELEGRPSFRAQFTKWNRSPDVADSVFQFTPPAGVERVQFSVRARNALPTEDPKP